MIDEEEFMKILVVSDTHGDIEALRKVIQGHGGINTVIHLGDGKDDIETIRNEYSEKKIYNVCGNCDYSDGAPQTLEIDTAGIKILATHGHLFKVKKDLEKLIAEAKKRGARIALYGHTHIPRSDFKDGIHIMNPGSLNNYIGTYGILSIEEEDISIQIFNI